MKKTIYTCLCLIFLLALFPVTRSAESPDSIFYSDGLEMEMKMSSTFALTGSEGNSAQYARAQMFFFPVDGDNLDVLSLETTPTSNFVSDYLEFYWRSPSLRKYSYSIDSRLRTHNRLGLITNKINFPISNLPDDTKEYLQKTQKIDINDDIIRLASELAEGEDDLAVVVYKLAKWTKENINYSITTKTAEASQNASWVLKNRYGVCDELTNLFISFCRSLGIPARFVSGISYTNSDLFAKEWGLHGWAEVYFPGYGWLPYDPTYGQFSYVDSGHIKLKDSLDSEKSSTKFEWQGDGINLEPGELAIDVIISDYGSRIAKQNTVAASAFSKTVGFGSYNIIVGKFKNPNNYYASFESTLSSTKEITKISPATQFILLRPYEEKSLLWIVQVDGGLDKKYTYTFPFEISTTLGTNGKGQFLSENLAVRYGEFQIQNILENLLDKEEKAYAGKADFSCVYPKAIFINESFSVTCNVKNTGNIFLKSLKVCLQDSCKYEDVGISQSKNVTFAHRTNILGLQELTASAKNKDLSIFNQLSLIAEDFPLISIENVAVPEELKFENFDIGFDINKLSLSSPKNAKVEFSFNGKASVWDLKEMEESQKFSVSIDPSNLNLNQNSLLITVKYQDRNGKEYMVKHEQSLSLGKVNFYQKIFLWTSEKGRWIESLFTR